MSQKIHLLLMYGGQSGEHEVSLRSAASVLRALNQKKYKITCLAGDKNGQWYRHSTQSISANTQSLPVRTDGAKSESLSVELFADIDVVLPIMHGPLYEDGCLQGLLQLANVAYVGANQTGSALAMDKELAKLVVSYGGIAVAPGVVIHSGQKNNNQLLEKAINQFGFPLFVKPACLGSSVGTHKVNSIEALSSAVEDAALYDSKVMVEQAIVGREVELAVLQQKTEVLVSEVAGEIIMREPDGFYCYQSKYIDEEAAQLVAPSELSSSDLSSLRTKAKQIFTLLQCRGLARVDFFLEQDGTVIFNELNTLPGFTSISMYPKLWQLSNKPYDVLLDNLIEQAMWQHQQDSMLLRDYQ